jgi:outer membrane protein OmpA-like peptidoglycan-associated protein
VTRRIVALAVALAGCPRPDSALLVDQLERELLALHDRLRVAEAEAETCGEGPPNDALYRDLAQIYAETDGVFIDKRGGTLVLTFPADDLFSSGTTLRAEARMGLDLLATALSVHRDVQVLIEGHSDDRGLLDPGPARFVESWERAKAVAKALIVDFQVDETRITLAARGPFSPVASNDIPAGQAQNRRVMVYLSSPRER